MNTLHIALKIAVLEARLALALRHNAMLVNQVDDLTSIVRSIPSQLATARHDALEGVATRYNYDAAQKACAIRIP